MNIAVLAHWFLDWGGGRDFILACIKALTIKSQTIPLQLFVLIPSHPGETDINALNDWLREIGKIGSNIVLVVYERHPEDLRAALEAIKADVALPACPPLGEDFPIPWIGYVFDFQHKYHPEFCLSEIAYRDYLFGAMTSQAKVIIVNAHTIESDIFKFYPDAPCKVYTLPFNPAPNPDWFEEREDVLTKYGLAKSYFLICNQFWIHKDHKTAIEALALLKQQTGVIPQLVCTGKTADYRWPGHFEQLESRIKELGIQDNVRILGFIPKHDQIQLVRKSLAVIQPTLCEGGPGGGSVYNAVSLGVPVILSDIPVNKEISGDRIFFFKAGSAEDLYQKMASLLALGKLPPLEKDVLMERGRIVTQTLGNKLLEAIHCAIELG